MEPWPSPRVVSVHLLALSALALAHPIFQLLSGAAEFFVAYNAGGPEILALVTVVLFLIPVGAILVALALRRVGLAWHRAFVTLCVGIAVFAMGMQTVKGMSLVGAGLSSVAIGACLGILAAVAYLRMPGARFAATAMSPAIIIVPALFLLNGSILGLINPSAAAQSLGTPRTNTPVVIVVFDALPLASLLDARRQIDARYYPAFARLADDGLWFRNATTAATHTRWAMPAILTGKYPQHSETPTVFSHPGNLLALFGSSHQVRALEPLTALCPRELCPKPKAPFASRLSGMVRDLMYVYAHLVIPQPWVSSLPAVDEKWSKFDGRRRELKEMRLPSQLAKAPFAAPGPPLEVDDEIHGWRSKVFGFIDSISLTEVKPGFWFMHVVLPHRPYLYLPTGQFYEHEPSTDPAFVAGFLVPDGVAVAQSYQRHLLQLGYADTILGTLMERLRTVGLYDEALVAVLADHGETFQPGDSRRQLTALNRPDIMSIPMIIKPPGRGGGRIIDADVESIDFVPTIAEILNFEVPWHTDGRSAMRDSATPREGRRIFGRRFLGSQPSDMEPEHLLEMEWEPNLLQGAILRKLALFQDGDPLRPRFVSEGLVGQVLSQFEVQDDSDVTVKVDDLDEFRAISTRADYLPLRVTGTVVDGRGERRERIVLAVAINGRIGTVTSVLSDSSWSAMLPLASVKDGANNVEVFMVSSGGSRLTLLRPRATALD